MALLIRRQDEILAELKTLADENFDKSREEYDRALRAWRTSFRLSLVASPNDLHLQKPAWRSKVSPQMQPRQARQTALPILKQTALMSP